MKKPNKTQQKVNQANQQLIAILGIVFFLVTISYAIDTFQTQPFLFVLLILGLVTLVYIGYLIFCYYRFTRLQLYNSIETMVTMDPRDFEHYICMLLGKLGYQAQVRSGNQDGGVDVDAYKNNTHTVVQCKRYNPKSKISGNISVMAVRELYGVARSIGPSVQCLFVTTSNYSEEAIRFAESNNIELWNGHDIVEILSQIKIIKSYDHFFDRLVNYKFK